MGRTRSCDNATDVADDLSGRVKHPCRWSIHVMFSSSLLSFGPGEQWSLRTTHWSDILYCPPNYVNTFRCAKWPESRGEVSVNIAGSWRGLILAAEPVLTSVFCLDPSLRSELFTIQTTLVSALIPTSPRRPRPLKTRWPNARAHTHNCSSLDNFRSN